MWRKICHVEKFQISMRGKCGEIWNFSTCGVISNFAIWKMWRNLKFLHIWHVCDVENASTCVKFMLFCCKIGFVAIYALLSQISFVAIYALLCGEKINNKLCVWRKNDRYQVWDPTPLLLDLLDLIWERFPPQETHYEGERRSIVHLPARGSSDSFFGVLAARRG